jgi:hypothetical protein
VKRRGFLAAVAATALVIGLSPSIVGASEYSRSGILRRRDKKRARWYRRRDRKRHPLNRLLKNVYANIRVPLAPVWDNMDWGAGPKRWGGTNYYYDVVIS